MSVFAIDACSCATRECALSFILQQSSSKHHRTKPKLPPPVKPKAKISAKKPRRDSTSPGRSKKTFSQNGKEIIARFRDSVLSRQSFILIILYVCWIGFEEKCMSAILEFIASDKPGTLVFTLMIKTS